MNTFKIYIGMTLLTTTQAMDEREAEMIFKPYVKKKYGVEAANTLRIVQI